MGIFSKLFGGSDDTSSTQSNATPPDHADPEPDRVSDTTPPDDVAEIEEQIHQISQRLDSGDGEGWELQESLGILHERLGDTDAAITAFEASLSEKPRYGDSYNHLMALYNDKRAEAAAAGDGRAINEWMSKIDDLLATSKRVMRENY